MAGTTRLTMPQISHHIALSTVVLSCLAAMASSFSTSTLQSPPFLFARLPSTAARRSSVTILQAAGMGMAVKSKSKKDKKKKKKSSTPFDANASLLRLEKRYEELSKAKAKSIQDDNNDVVTSEYVIAARASGTAAVSDWVPVAQMCIARPWANAEESEGVTDPSVQAVVSQYCREIYQAATLGAPVFKSLPRNNIQYSVESMDSFHKHVYETIVEGNSEKAQDQVMTKSDARAALKLDENENDMAEIKKAYRALSFELHPDRVAVSSDEQVQSASDQYARVKLAYETLNSGIRSSDASWYESLGGRARTEFVGPLTLLSLDKAKAFLASRANLDSAVVGLDPEVVQTFVARNQAAS